MKHRWSKRYDDCIQIQTCARCGMQRRRREERQAVVVFEYRWWRVYPELGAAFTPWYRYRKRDGLPLCEVVNP